MAESSSTTNSYSDHSERLEPQILRAVESDDVGRLEQIITTAKTNGRLSDQLLSIALARSSEKGKFGATQYLLSQGAKHVGTRITPLFRAVERNNVAIVELLLSYDASIEARDKKGRTALMLAAWKNHQHILELLLRRGADVNARDARNRHVLHNLAADKQCDWGKSIVELLLEQDMEINGIDILRRTPLHWACATGKLFLAEMLLTRPGKVAAYVDAVSLRGKSSLHLAAMFGHDDIVELLLRHGANANCKSDGGWAPLHNAAEKGSLRIVRMLLAAGANVNERLSNGVTPLHLAAQGGYLEVIKHLFEVREIEWAPRDTFGSTPLHRAAQNRYKDCFHLLAPSNHIDHLSEDIIGACKGFEATIVFFGNFRNENRVERISVYDLLYSRDSTNSLKARPVWLESKATNFQWIHLPANNLAWVQALFTNTFIEDGGSDVEYLKSLEQTLTHQHRGRKIHSQFMRPLCQTWPRSSSVRTKKASAENSASSNLGPITMLKNERNVKRSKTFDNSDSDARVVPGIAVFMPYLHYEVDSRRKEMEEVIKQATIQSPRARQKARNQDEMQVQGYLNEPSAGLHIRRTLDQCFLHNSDTTIRDQDQVVYRYQKRNAMEPTIIMVDQLWMWILDDQRIVTAFPQRWQQPKDDPLNLLDGIIDNINSKTRAPVKSVYDLAVVITECCSSILDDRGGSEDRYQFFKMFEASIGLANDMEANLFLEFNAASMEASQWLERNRRVSRSTDDDGSDFDSHGSAAVDKLLYIGKETSLLNETKDIRDELGMLSSVYNDQMRVIPDLLDAISDIYKNNRQSQQDLRRRFTNEMRRIEVRIKDLERMDKQTARIYSSILDMLDLKQKHAANTNVFEARFAREQAEGNARQNQTLMVFTIVTIIFLPLSFIAAFFTINIGEFQKSADNTLSLAYVSKWVFGVGLAISIPLVILALNLEKIVRYYRKLNYRMNKRRSRKYEAFKEV